MPSVYETFSYQFIQLTVTFLFNQNLLNAYKTFISSTTICSVPTLVPSSALDAEDSVVSEMLALMELIT